MPSRQVGNGFLEARMSKIPFQLSAVLCCLEPLIKCTIYPVLYTWYFKEQRNSSSFKTAEKGQT